MAMPTAPTATPQSRSTGSLPKSASSSGTKSPVFTIAIELVGVVALSIIAGVGEKTGRVIVLCMVALLVLWLVLNAATLAKLMPGTNVGA